ncbi:MAG: 3-oxoadipate enol-lactonase [Caldilineaceae bacterium]
MNFASIGDIAFHYTYRPAQTGPTLVFLNSLGSDLRIWQEVIARLPAHLGILCFDQRGHGLSDAPSGPYTLPQLAADLRGLLNHLVLRQVVLVGVSVGGMIAQQFALSDPERVRGLVLCDTGARIATADYWSERATAVRRGGLAPLAHLILARWVSGDYGERHPAAHRGYANMLVRTPAEGYAATCDALRDGDLRVQVSAIQVPTLVLCGADDLATPPTLGEELAAAIPHARFALIANAGHIPALEEPDAVAAHIRSFLEGLPHGP